MLPSERGSYALIVEIGKQIQIKIGSLGKQSFKKGFYCYVGSARGPGGIRARISHHIKSHMREEKKHHWHIDHLLTHARPLEVWFSFSLGEGDIADHLLARFPYTRGFGSTDSSRPSHLFYSPKKEDFSQALKALGMENLSLEPQAPTVTPIVSHGVPSETREAVP